MNRYIFASLLHIDKRNFGSPNNKNNSPDSYLRQIKLLNSTLYNTFGQELVVITNDKEQVESFFADEAMSPKVINYEPTFQPPINLTFYGAHFKLEAFKAGLKLLSKGAADYFCLLDCDIIANMSFDQQQEWLISKSDIAVYDISDYVFPAYGVREIWENLELVGGVSYTNPKWFGGEFLMATEKGLKELITECEHTLELYLKYHSELHHSGDEMFVSSALNNIIEQGDINVVEIGTSKVIGRHWAQLNYISFDFFKTCNFIHCPGSKQILEVMSSMNASKNTRLYMLKIWQIIVRIGRRVRGL